MANIARLAAVLGLDTAEFQQGLASAKRQLNDFADKLPTVAAVATAAFAAMTYKAMQMADQMSDLADATDVSVESILKISEALEQSGGKAEAADRVLLKFAQSIDEAAQGSKSAQEAFARAGVSLKDLASGDIETLFNKTVDGIAKLGDKASQSGVAFTLMGKAIKGTDMEGFNNRIKESSDNYKKYADAIRAAADLHDKLAAKSMKTALIFTQQLMPTINAFFDKINMDGGAAENVFSAINKVLVGTYYAFSNASIAMQTMFNGAKDFLSLDWGETPEKLNRDNELVLERVRLLKETKDLLNGTGGKPVALGSNGNGNTPPRTVKAAKDTELNQLLKELETLKLISQQYTARLDEQAKLVQLKTDMITLTTNESQIAQAMYELDKERADTIGKLMDKRQTAIDLKADQKVIDMLDQQIAKVNETTDAYKEQIRGLIEYQQELEQSYMGGVYLSYKKYQDLAINNAATVESMVDSLFDNMTKAIDNFVQTGKFSFKDFANSVIQDLIRIAIRAQMLKLFSMVLSGFSGAAAAAPTGGDINALDTGGAMGGAGNYGIDGANAEGGTISAGGAYLVGERGPELFVPGRSGSVIPNNELSNIGNQPQAVYNGPYIANMSAIDTQSAMQFLAKNKMAVYSANMSATRSIPTSVR